VRIVIQEDPLVVEDYKSFASDKTAGGCVVFIGTVRNQTKGKEVLRLEFETYESMAISELEKIVERASVKWDLIKVAIAHRTGILGIGEIPVVIAISSAHRKAAFEACEFCIDELKKTVPIWKKEVFQDGEQWVSPTP
jgi:molybdopterin synthase catalytic subunit